MILALGKVRRFKETTEDTDLRRGLIDIDSELEIGESSSNSGRIIYIYLLGKGMNTSLFAF